MLRPSGPEALCELIAFSSAETIPLGNGKTTFAQNGLLAIGLERHLARFAALGADSLKHGPVLEAAPSEFFLSETPLLEFSAITILFEAIAAEDRFPRHGLERHFAGFSAISADRLMKRRSVTISIVKTMAAKFSAFVKITHKSLLLIN